MKITEYSTAKAEALLHLNLSNAELPFKIQWLDILNSKDRKDRLCSIYRGSHTHTFYEIHYVFSGNISYNICEDSFKLTAGEAVIIPPKTPHKYSGSSAEFIKASLAFTLEDEQFSNLVFCNKFNFNEKTVNNINFILNQTGNNDIFTLPLISGKITEILHSAFLSLGITSPKSYAKHKDSRLNTAIKFINNHMHKLINCEDVAKECCLSIKQLDRIFKKNINMSTHEFIINERINYAKKLIYNGEYSIKEIAYKLGFKNVSNFNIFFKRHIGITPGKYRKNI